MCVCVCVCVCVCPTPVSFSSWRTCLLSTDGPASLVVSPGDTVDLLACPHCLFDPDS